MLVESRTTGQLTKFFKSLSVAVEELVQEVAPPGASHINAAPYSVAMVTWTHLLACTHVCVIAQLPLRYGNELLLL